MKNLAHSAGYELVFKKKMKNKNKKKNREERRGGRGRMLLKSQEGEMGDRQNINQTLIFSRCFPSAN